MYRTMKQWIGLGAVLAMTTVGAQAGQVDSGADGHAMNPTWSADGKFLAFEVNAYGGDGISMFFAAMNRDTSTKVQQVQVAGATSAYSDGGPVVMNAAWHPAGVAVFEGSNSGGKIRLYNAQPFGAAPTEMLDKNQAPGNLQFPVISASGFLMGYTSNQFGAGDVMTWDRAANKVIRNTKSADSEVFPMFDKPGKNVLFARKRTSGATIYEVGVDGTGERLVAGGSGDLTRPVYAGANEDLILYFSNERDTANWDLKQMNRSGGGVKTLAKNVRLPERARPAVDPTGKYVSYTLSEPAEMADSVFIINLASGAKKEIKTEFTACGEPALGRTKDGSTVLAYTALPGEKAAYRFLYAQEVTNVLP